MKGRARGHKKTLGDFGERVARRYLRRKGYRIVANNVELTHGELDIIAVNAKYIVFAEVKTRTDSGALAVYGRPARAVGREKRAHLISAIHEYLREHPGKKQPRADIIEVYVPEGKRSRFGLCGCRVEHIESAFGEEPRHTR